VSRKSDVITVRVNRQVLWIGAEAYPLHNIARAQTIKLVPNRAAAWRHYLVAVVVWLILGIAATASLNAASSNATSIDEHDAITNALPAVAHRRCRVG
jgi:hypothetical protein